MHANSWLQVVNSDTVVHTATLFPQLQILEQYWENWKRKTAATVDFQFERRFISKRSVCGKLSNVKGLEWKATLIDSEVSRIQSSYALVCVYNFMDTVVYSVCIEQPVCIVYTL